MIAKILLVLLGWFLGVISSYLIGKKTATRKENWDKLADLNKKLNELVSSSITYYSVPEKQNREAAIKVQTDLRLLIADINNYAFILNDLKKDMKYLGLCIRLRYVITASLDNVAAIVEMDKHIEEIEDSAGVLSRYLMVKFTEKYR